MSLQPNKSWIEFFDKRAVNDLLPVCGQGQEIRLILQPPRDINLHVIFRQFVEKAPILENIRGYRSYFITHPKELIPLTAIIWKNWGMFEYIRTLAKLSTSTRNLFLFINAERTTLSAYGWVSTGISKYYPVTPRDVVIGPIWTAAECRGVGLATSGLQLTIREMFSRGYRTFFIDTREENIGCMKAAFKAGFIPVAAHWKGY